MGGRRDLVALGREHGLQRPRHRQLLRAQRPPGPRCLGCAQEEGGEEGRAEEGGQEEGGQEEVGACSPSSGRTSVSPRDPPRAWHLISALWPRKQGSSRGRSCVRPYRLRGVVVLMSNHN